ncbi:hypothetical protein DENIS_3486 [Desulfonema ishimotonii]|uniref:Uncharacterized protein n=1 Tax=Desulfonema ishimotonii TaxID=45657 RepID=A0A401FZW4_9BACT|nr:hypothetical protein [Desulfonema ishimotonii]GBC62514.1 hypothetical protein DENIS_3486 [Desulfonema ishimotonii]
MITKDEWAEIEQTLNARPFSGVTLMADGYKLELYSTWEGIGNKNRIRVYVNDKVKGRWTIEDCEVRSRFYCRTEKALFPKKKQRELKRVGVKDSDQKIASYWPEWTSFRKLKAHLVRNNTEIELIATGEGL